MVYINILYNRFIYNIFNILYNKPIKSIFGSCSIETYEWAFHSVKQVRMKIREVELFQGHNVNWQLSKQSRISTRYGDPDASGLCSQEFLFGTSGWGHEQPMMTWGKKRDVEEGLASWADTFQLFMWQKRTFPWHCIASSLHMTGLSRSLSCCRTPGYCGVSHAAQLR